MKKVLLLISLLLGAIVLSSCASNVEQTNEATTSSNNDNVVQEVGSNSGSQETGSTASEGSSVSEENFDLNSHKDTISAVEKILEYY